MLLHILIYSICSIFQSNSTPELYYLSLASSMFSVVTLGKFIITVNYCSQTLYWEVVFNTGLTVYQCLTILTVIPGVTSCSRNHHKTTNKQTNNFNIVLSPLDGIIH